MSNYTEEENEENPTYLKAVEQSKRLLKELNTYKNFQALSKVEQNRILMAEYRKQNPSSGMSKAIYNITSSTAKVIGNTPTKSIFQGTYLKNDCSSFILCYNNNQGFLRLVKSDNIEIDVSLNVPLALK
jgi:hypothetical protein